VALLQDFSNVAETDLCLSRMYGNVVRDRTVLGYLGKLF
jgi:calcineurin-like phosphoesterase family protein